MDANKIAAEAYESSRIDALLDEALKMTFPASDPIAVFVDLVTPGLGEQSGVRRWRNTISERVRAAAMTTDEAVQEHPWTTAGIAAGLGAALGLLVAVRILRR